MSLQTPTKFQPQYQPVIDELTLMLKSGLGDNLHSFYVYGSVASGLAVPNQSNVDLIIVTHHRPDQKFHTFINTLKWRITSKYPMVTDVSVLNTTVSQVLSLESIFTWGFKLRHCAICLHGTDLGESFGDFEPSWEIAKYWNWDIEDYLQQQRRKLVKVSDPDEQVNLQKQLAKKMLRASYSLILHRHKKWIEDPAACGKTFLHYHPEKQTDIQRLMILCGERVIAKRSVIGIIDNYGDWLAKSYKKTEFRIG